VSKHSAGVPRAFFRSIIFGALLLSSTPVRAEEEHSVMTALSSTTLSGFVDTSWWFGAPLPWLEMALEKDGRVSTYLHGTPGQSCRISASQDLKEWTGIADLTLIAADALVFTFDGGANLFLAATPVAP
jgi:hypothetical protein